MTPQQINKEIADLSHLLQVDGLTDKSKVEILEVRLHTLSSNLQADIPRDNTLPAFLRRQAD